MVFHWSLSDNKSSQVSRTILSILTDLNNAVIWMVSTHPVISKSFSPCTNLLMTGPTAPITICILVTLLHFNFENVTSRFNNPKQTVLIPRLV